MVKNRLTRSPRSVHALGDQPPSLFRVLVLELLKRDLDRSLSVGRLGATEKLTARIIRFPRYEFASQVSSQACAEFTPGRLERRAGCLRYAVYRMRGLSKISGEFS
jgi:hypothetical protein